jgi:DNA modification methylase
VAQTQNPDPFFTVHLGDSRELGVVLDRESGGACPPITCTITSPPYADLINYKVANQVGWGQTYTEYLADCREIFGAVFDRTADDGALWLVADTVYDQSKRPSVVRPLPFDLARVAGEAGWTLRDVVIWKKDKTRPWSGRGRLRNIFEYVLFLVKSDHYKYNVDSLREAKELSKWWVQYPERFNPQGKAPTNLWEIPIPTQGTWANSAVQHACPLPPDLIERILFLSTDPGDVVFDPFAGSGTVVAEAERLGRRGVGVELNPKYVEAYRRVVRPEIMLRRGVDQLAERASAGERLRHDILRLRAVKYPKTMWKQFVKKHPANARPRLAVSSLHSGAPEILRNPHQLIDVLVTFVFDGPEDERKEMEILLKEVAANKPLTGFGVAGDIRVVHSDELASVVDGGLYLYEHGRTWRTSGLVTVDQLLDTPVSPKTGGYIPIAANVSLDLEPHRLYA